MIKGLKKIEFISPQIIHLNFDKRRDLCNVFLRFSEYYESPKYKGQNFSRQQFARWFKKTYKKSYINEWSGFNIPSSVLDAEMFKDKENLTVAEKAFINFFKNFKGKFYIIGSNNQDKDAKRHEICHALFYLNFQYRNKVLKEISKFDVKNLKDTLIKCGYCKDVLLDEVNAYVGCGNFDSLEGIKNPRKYSKLHKKLNNLFIKHCKRLNINYKD